MKTSLKFLACVAFMAIAACSNNPQNHENGSSDSAVNSSQFPSQGDTTMLHGGGMNDMDRDNMQGDTGMGMHGR